MEWSQVISSFGVITTIIVTIITAVRWLDSRIERINEKSETRHNNTIKEWREEHSKQIDKQDNLIKEWRDEHKAQMSEWREEHKSQMNEWREEHKAQLQESDKHWREMFIHFNSRLDNVTGKA